MTCNIHLRGVDNQLMHQLKIEASKQEVSVNTLILTILMRGLGLSIGHRLSVYHNLDKFSGTWSKQQTKAFLREIADFEQIDKELWK